ncbi:HepT-like ribonuclease domain-containing protein [Rhodoferax aquaticus]|uniref:DUF86 domain-containing protein n=1 Tax=Rhodoferax aquaticus TaxID=2527691 RepID=A0A515EPH1_9BURK|nr:DUF86 domain-containing protein [Rhodoferax aquaticus]QDL54564.1 DUF86 domain-containing protein [Rhodoferax aquaticus]
MSTNLQRLAEYLGHILEAIERIEHYVADLDELAFLNSKLVQDAVIRNFEIIGEASNNIEKRYPDFVKAHPELPLASAYQMRNAMAHGYFKVDYEVFWKTICNYLPNFYQLVKAAASSH